ncbi:MAG: hypothetical protein COT84_01845 [Chlamydiae bacterium CG10_big_fil_rev_8_21_14_0_10_35_9]|nr:MAG: hypothetical protein COT84_01845 [Chlamydiae bacterium CG10_big_fil_rev_8_21_14_0_10_35_9]
MANPPSKPIGGPSGASGQPEPISNELSQNKKLTQEVSRNLRSRIASSGELLGQISPQNHRFSTKAHDDKTTRVASHFLRMK